MLKKGHVALLRTHQSTRNMRSVSTLFVGIWLVLSIQVQAQLIPSPTQAKPYISPVSRLRPFPCFPQVFPHEVPVTGGVRDQLRQGPCYIFATVAALESRGLLSCTDIGSGFHEWSLYNSCLLESRTGSAHIMIERVVDAAIEEGLLDRQHNIPHSKSELPNKTDGMVPGIGDFQCPNFCHQPANNRLFIHTADPSGTCTDKDNEQFDVLKPGSLDARYKLVEDPNAPAYPSHLPPLGSYPLASGNPPPTHIPTPSPTTLNILKYIDLNGVSEYTKTQTMMYLLDNGYGCIALFDKWKDGGSHCVFIYGGDGCSWDFKDSWPDDAELGSGSLDLKELSQVYFITGFVKKEEVNCQDVSIVADESQYPLSYSVEGGQPNPCSITWTVSGGAIVSGQGTRSIVVCPSSTTSSVQVDVELSSPTLTCAAHHTFQASPSLKGILMQGVYWDDGTQTACPDERFIAQTDSYTGGSYDWQVSGAQLIGASNGAQIKIKTSNVSYASLLVKARLTHACFTEPWISLNGHVNGNGLLCDGGIIRLADESLLTIADRTLIWHGQLVSLAELQGPVRFTLTELSGRVVYQQHLFQAEERIALTSYASGIYLVSIEGGGVMLREKILLR